MAGILLDPRALTVASSFVTWLIYKIFEPSSVLASFVLLVLLPGAIVQQTKSHFSSWAWAAFVTYSFFWSLVVTFIAAYRVSPFHPLAKYPGPLSCKITKFKVASEYGKGNARTWFMKMHQQYGEVVRIGPNELSFKTADAINPILLSKPLPKGPYYDSRIQNNVHQLDGMRDFTMHSKRRKLWNKSVAPGAIKEYGEMLKGVIDELVEELTKKDYEVVDMSAWMGYTTFDFMGRMAFSKSFGLVKAGKDEDGLMHAVDQGTGDAAVISHIPWILPFLNILPPVGASKFLQSYTANLAKERIQNGAVARDLFSYIIAEDEPEESRPSKEAATSDSMLAVIAGSDTSATALSHVFYFLLRNPHCMERLRKEIDTTIPDADEMTDYSRQADMPYLNACINEAMRLYLPVQAGVQRRVERGTGGRLIGKYFVPEDTQVSVHIPLLQRDPRYFSPIPDEFWPDRFLSQEAYVLPTGETIAKNQLIHNRNVFLPFSAGPQNCAGRAIAQQEMRAVLCAVLKRFDVEVAEGFDMDSWERNLRDYYVSHRGPLMVRIRDRKV